MSILGLCVNVKPERCHYIFDQTHRMHHNGRETHTNGELWVTSMCHCRFINEQCTILIGDTDNVRCRTSTGGSGSIWDLSEPPLSFSVNL